MSSVVNWVKKNQRKLVVGSAVVGGLYVVGKIAERQLIKNQELETQKLLEKARKQNHFSATESTCAHTLAALFPTLRHNVEDNLDAERITKILRGKPSPEDKIEFWNELKVIAVSRCVVLVVGGVYLSVMIRAQLNILAGYLYEQEIAGAPNNLVNNNIQKGKFSSVLQEKFLNICTYFVSEGITKLCSCVSEIVKRCTAKIGLNQKLSLVDLEAVFNDVFENFKTVDSNRNIFNNPGIFFLPGTEGYLSDIHPSDQVVLKKMLAETLDVVDSEDSISMVHLVCKQGLSHTVDKIADYYAAIGLAGSLDTPSSSNLQTKTKNALHDSGFVSPANVSLPLAKLIPILSAQIRVPSEEEDTWLLHLQDNPAIKLLGANVYEAFCESASDKPASVGWGEYFYNAYSSWF